MLEYADKTLTEPIPLPGPVASELSISAGGSMVAMTVQGPSMPRTVELVDPRSREWERIDREPSGGPAATDPALVTIRARDGLDFTGWLYRPPAGVDPVGALIYLHGGPEGAGAARLQRNLPRAAGRRYRGAHPECPRFRRIWPDLLHADDKELRFAAIDDVADCVALPGRRRPRTARPHRLLRLVLRRLPDAGGVDLPPRAVRRRHQHLRDERFGHVLPQHRAVDRRGRLSQIRSSRSTIANCSTGCRPCSADEALTAPLLLVHGANDTNVPPSESQQMFDALRRLGRTVECLMFDDDGHQIVKRENREALVRAIKGWLTTAFAQIPISVTNPVADRMFGKIVRRVIHCCASCGAGHGWRRSMRGILGVIVLVWLLIGVFAAYQRDYFKSSETNCATAGTIALTVRCRAAELRGCQSQGNRLQRA